MFKFLPRLSNMVAAIAIAAAVIALIAQENHEWVSSAIQYLETHNPIITAIATALLACVTGGLVWMAYLQIKTTRAQLRAYVFPESASLCDGSMLIPPNPAKANEPGVVFTWKNTGQTPASNVVSWGQIAVIEPINENRLTIPTLQNEFARHVGAGATGSKSLWFGRALTANEIADVAAGARAIYWHGRIEYRDIFGKRRFSNFRMAYSGPFPPPSGAIFFVCEKGNDAE